MKKVVSAFYIFLFLLASDVSANGAGLPQFFKINGKQPTTNPLQIYGITAQSFLLPQDIAPEAYLIDEPIEFLIETEPLSAIIPEELLAKTTYSWDFGDGAKGEGLQNTHAYTKMGSYILILTINVYAKNDQSPTQFVDTFLLNIVPAINYSNFPQTVIKINDTYANTDPRYNLVHLNFNETVNFDATASKTPGSKIAALFWNFGDGETSILPKVNHKYGKKDFVAAVLRIKDSNGFISDAFVGLKNAENLPDTHKRGEQLFYDKTIIISLGIISICVSIIAIVFLSKKKHS